MYVHERNYSTFLQRAESDKKSPSLEGKNFKFEAVWLHVKRDFFHILPEA